MNRRTSPAPKRRAAGRTIRHVILPGTEADLLRRELAHAFHAEGLRVTLVPPAELHDPGGERRLEVLLQDGPTLLFSVNFQGLDPLRPVLERVASAGGKVAAWVVDNPWNILSGVRDPRWKELTLFVTDETFLAPLAAHGAARARYLPLAASFAFFAPEARREAAFPPPSGLAPFVFVGRSAFPGKERFFAGQELPPGALEQARGMLAAGKRPDLLWWEALTCSSGDVLWPGKKARTASLGAEEANLAWRAACVLAAADRGNGGNACDLTRSAACDGAEAPGRTAGGGVDVFGDDGWRRLIAAAGASGGIRLLSPVDYYARLPGIYKAARYSLCLTSLQLPAGLNQRHFDVWAAGGFALSDATPGLALFPQALTRPVTFRRAGDIRVVAERLEAGTDREALKRAWRDCLMERHTYRHRVRKVLEALQP